MVHLPVISVATPNESRGANQGRQASNSFLRESSNVIASEAREVGHRDRGGNTVNVQLSGDEVMRNLRFVLVALLAFVVTSAGTIPSSAHHAISQSQGSTALERGYRTGYSDGYNAGFKDVA